MVFLVWGSTYLAHPLLAPCRATPPLLFPGVRYTVAGVILYALLRLRGAPAPSWRQWGGGALIGFLLIDFGNGAVVYAERSVGSGLAATAVSTAPLWAALFAGIWGQWPARMQWLGMALGFAGVVVLNLGGDFAANPLAAAGLTLSPMVWSFGSVWSRRLDLPKGLMSSAAQMLAAGVVFLVASAACGERAGALAAARRRSAGALLYLTVLGSLVAYSAYIYLVQNVSPVLATSNSYVNPVVALFLGVALGGEHIRGGEFGAIALILVGVLLIVFYEPSRA